MKRFIISILAAVLFAGCSSLHSVNSLATLAGLAIAPVLANNPGYIPVAQVLADELSSLSSGTIDLSSVPSFAAQIATRRGLSAQDAAFAEVILTALLTSYTDSSGLVQVDIGTSKPFVGAFATGLRSATTLAAQGSARAGPEPMLARYTAIYEEGVR